MKTHEALGILLLIIVVCSGGYVLFNRGPLQWPPVQPSDTPTVGPATPTNTITPPPEKGHEAVTKESASCFDWSNKPLISIDPLEPVSVRGRNQAATWYMVKWDKFGDACWVQADLLKPRNFRPEDLYVILQPFPPPTFTPSLTSTVTPTPTLTPTLIFVTVLPATPTDKPTKTLISPTPTGTPISPTPTDTPISPTPTDTPISPTPTDTPISPTPTKTDTLTPPCNSPAAPRLTLTRHGQNVDLSWNSIPDAVSYDIYRSVGTGSFSLLKTTTATSYRDSLPNNTTHHYYVVVTNSCGEKNTSETKDISR